MFDFIRFVHRNPIRKMLKWRQMSAVRKAMDKYRKEHTTCAWCGRTKKLEVHHIIPVSVQPIMADNPENMIMLCRKPPCHQVVGHNGNFATRYQEDVRELCEQHRTVKVLKERDNVRSADTV